MLAFAVLMPGLAPDAAMGGVRLAPSLPQCSRSALVPSQRLPSPWFRADSVLESGGATMAGYHRICSNGSLVPPDVSNHMASAGDCCTPLFPKTAPEGLAGRLVYTKVYEHMLVDPIGTTPAAPATAEKCQCT